MALLGYILCWWWIIPLFYAALPRKCPGCKSRFMAVPTGIGVQEIYRRYCLQCGTTFNKERFYD